MSAYTLEGARWATQPITWSYATTNYPADAASAFSSVIDAQTRSAVQWALQQWISAANLQFIEIADSAGPAQAADLRIGFGLLDTQTTGIIGQTNLRWDGTGSLLPGQVVRLEDPAQMPLGDPIGGFQSYANTNVVLAQVALHEIGHALGIGHATDPQSVMYASLGSNNQALNQTDIDAVQALYGAPAAASPTPQPASPDVLVLHLAEDAWQGDAQFVVSLDGRPLGGPQSVTAAHASGQDQAFSFTGNFGAGAHDLVVSFLNDAWGGSDATDRNLYITGASLNGAAQPQVAAAMFAGGDARFNLSLPGMAAGAEIGRTSLDVSAWG